MERLEEAGQALTRYQELTQKQAVRESNLRRGQTAYQEGLTQLSEKRLDEASRSFQESLQFLSEKDASYYALASIHYRRREHLQAIELARRAIAVNPLVADYHILLAESLDKRGNSDQPSSRCRKSALVATQGATVQLSGQPVFQSW